MSKNRLSDAVRRVFTEIFTARDIAQPLPSFDADATCATVCDFMQAHDLDVVGIRADGQMAGFVEKDRLGDGTCGQCQHEFADTDVLHDTAPLLRVLVELNHKPYVFVTILGKVGGIITRADLQKPPVRMWLFGLVTLIEMRFTELIERHYPNESWKSCLSPGRLQKAYALLEERRRHGEPRQLIDCLQFADKGQIVARHEEIRQWTVFESRREAERTIDQLQYLRNNLAHAQDIVTDNWDTIIQLCEFVAQH